jgi:short-subunit dehydrogenase
MSAPLHRADAVSGLVGTRKAGDVVMTGIDLHGAAMVTGAARGIGALYAERFARRGRDLILVAGDRAALEEMAERLRPRGVRIEIVVADLARAEDLAAVETQLRGDDRIAVLVNDAQAGARGGDASSVPRLRVDGAWTARLARAAAEGFVAQRHGTILNVALAADAESSTLASFIAFSRSLSDELSPHGVHVKARVHRMPSSGFPLPRIASA